ncbi:hypothetical protein QSJ19_01695 [Gordonia sp. ABSL11-1]|uniref:hypothetical protein n=1 Tax=Gordonia sp. ABSL11-1 TaxID=3053924 RepID=UPI00257226D5|nr:hypothetical protein [Gordonia sp. ABSL11-1]MDL9944314.1 hypothetical protein [Gordonia sp. ABSL11-1]
MTQTPVPAKFEDAFAAVDVHFTFDGIAEESGVSVADATSALTGTDTDGATVQRIADALCMVPAALTELIVAH